MTKFKTRDAVMEAAWAYYASENPPDPGYSYQARRIFMAGFLRGRAGVMGLAWIYCTLVTIICTILLFFV